MHIFTSIRSLKLKWSESALPFKQVHVPDRVTRNLPPLDGPPPLVFSLSGSGGRGTAADAKRVGKIE